MIYNIIKSLQNTSSTNDKLAIMNEHKDNLLLREYMRLVSCPSVNFYITKKTIPAATGGVLDNCLDEYMLEYVTKPLYTREITGNDAKMFIKNVLETLDEEGRELYTMLLLKDIRAKVGVTLVNKVWPNLCVDVPYQRCSLPDEKIVGKFEKETSFYVQMKGDGMFAVLVSTESGDKQEMYTRNGSMFPSEFAQRFACVSGLNCAIEGELVCLDAEGNVLPRKEGNGILNSVLSGGMVPDGFTVKFLVWNFIPYEEWKNGQCSITYEQAFTSLMNVVGGANPYCVEVILTQEVESMNDAYAFNSRMLAQGFEGSIIKTKGHKWKNTTSKECVKLKLQVDVDLAVYDVVEGTGKAAGMLGALRLASDDEMVVVDCGTGFTDSQRKHLWEHRDSLIGKVVAVTANDLLDKKGSKTLSLFLPVFVEVREDKTQADSLERIRAMFKAAKSLDHNV